MDVWTSELLLAMESRECIREGLPPAEAVRGDGIAWLKSIDS